MKTLFANITLVIISLMIMSCSSEDNTDKSNDSGELSKALEPQLKALEKAKNVEEELLKRKKQIDEEEVKY